MAKIKTEEIGSQMKTIRQEKGITQEDVADKLNISQSSYAKLENGGTVIDIERLQEVADVLEVPNSEFIPETEKLEATQVISKKGKKVKYFQVDGRKLLKERNKRIKELEKEVEFLRKMLAKQSKDKD